MHEVRCNTCNKLLLKISGSGRVEVKCSRCKHITKSECRERQNGGDRNVQTTGTLAGRQTQTG